MLVIRTLAVTTLATTILAPACVMAQMVSGDSIGNDPVKEKICRQRSHGPFEKFEIDQRLVSSMRSIHPDATFIVNDTGLVTCWLNEGTGKYQPNMSGGPVGAWRVARPPSFSPGIADPRGREMAAQVCLPVVPQKINRPHFDHIMYDMVSEVTPQFPQGHFVTSVAGVPVARYDIEVRGTAFYKAGGVDLLGIDFRCLLSPTLDLKAVAVGIKDKRFPSGVPKEK